jgi:hypothetical protein
MTKFRDTVVESEEGFKGQMIQELVSYTTSGAISTDANIVHLDGTDGNVDMTLADGKTGQRIVIKAIAVGVNSVTVTPANFHDGTDITFGVANSVAELYFDGTEWELLYTDATVA